MIDYPLVGHGQIIAALDGECWKKHGAPIIVKTSSGSTYHITSDGVMTGGSHLVNGRTAKLGGAVYRKGGPIRAGHVVVGCSIEGYTSDGKNIITSPVEAIEAAK